MKKTVTKEKKKAPVRRRRCNDKTASWCKTMATVLSTDNRIRGFFVLDCVRIVTKGKGIQDFVPDVKLAYALGGKNKGKKALLACCPFCKKDFGLDRRRLGAA